MNKSVIHLLEWEELFMTMNAINSVNSTTNKAIRQATASKDSFYIYRQNHNI